MAVSPVSPMAIVGMTAQIHRSVQGSSLSKDAGRAWRSSGAAKRHRDVLVAMSGKAATARKGAKCLRKTLLAVRESAIAADGMQGPAAFFFHAPGAACQRAPRARCGVERARAANE
ncbi:hypothetical protein ABB22_13200 [Stenotrophomonas nitritireducens]|uniref:Uncharacterized protein n=2 Tax=Lysobacteraceae TaxID=32033 RepID=A0ABR5NHS0_9GAMM|nr:hypothetical protein ABB22_13200 [Stenotrophomonas nitritireducens]